MPRTVKRTGDPERLLDLLWTPDARVGRSGTTLGAVVARAIELADADGLDALTMRGLAEQMGVGAMTLYGYVPGKPELLALMVDAVVATTYEHSAQPAELADWEAALRHIALRNLEHGIAHSWLGQVPPSRPILGPGHVLKYEAELAPLDGIGLDDLAMDQTLTHVLAIAHHAARWAASMDRARDDSALTDDEWWHRVAPRLETVLDGRPLPISSRVGQTIADAGDPWRFCARAVEAVIIDVRHRVGGRPADGEPPLS